MFWKCVLDCILIYSIMSHIDSYMFPSTRLYLNTHSNPMYAASKGRYVRTSSTPRGSGSGQIPEVNPKWRECASHSRAFP